MGSVSFLIMTAFASPSKSFEETKWQAFSYKLPYRIIPCRHYLHIIHVSDSPLCQHCQEDDTILHFIIKSPKVKEFWRKLFHWCEQHVGLTLTNISELEMLFGFTERAAQIWLKNWILLNARFFIQKRNLFHNSDMSLLAFLADMRMSLTTEKLACRLEGKIGKFQCFSALYSALCPAVWG